MNFLKKAISILLSAVAMLGVFAVGAVNMTNVKAATVVHRGIDVSVYQGSIDFGEVKAAGYDYVIIRAGYGQVLSQKDQCFEQNYSRAKAAGLDVGVYWYSYASSVDAAKLEANVCLQVIKGKKFEYPIYFDLEESSQLLKGKSFCDSLVRTFCGKIEEAGYYAGLYMSRSPLTTNISPSVAADYALWVAEYGSACNYNGSYGMWQYSSTGRVSGISGNVDMNYCYVDYPSIIKKVGLNGYAASGGGSSTPSKTIDQLADEVFDGKWGDGNERKQRLTDAGYDYVAVQKRVQEIVDEAEKAVFTLSKTSLTIENGRSVTVTATVNPKNAANKNIKWETNNNKVATVSGGKITAVGVGTAVIKATAYTKTATCTVNVTPTKTIDQLAEEVFDGKWGDGNERKQRLTDAGYDYVAVQKRVQEIVDEAEKAVFTLSKTSLTIENGRSVTVTATVNPKNAANKNIKWETNNNKVATVSGGKITAVGVGTAVIKATAYTKTATCTVTVKEPVPNLVNNSSVSSYSITFGESLEITGSATGGTGPYTYKFEAKGSTDTGYTLLRDYTSTATKSWTPKRSGTYSVQITVKDSTGKTTNKILTITVNSILTNNSTVSVGSITKGSSVKLTGKASGGTGPYTYKFEAKERADAGYTVLQTYTTAATKTWTPKRSGTYSVRITVKDKTDKTVAKTLTLTVKTALIHSSTISTGSIIKGSSVVLTGAASGGTGPYTYKFEAKQSSDPSYTVLQSYTTNATKKWTPSRSGTYSVQITVKDSTGKATNKILTLTVNSILTNNSTVSVGSITKGSSVKLTGKASGGTGPYTYKFEAKERADAGYTVLQTYTTAATKTWTPKRSGTYSIRITVKDKTDKTVAKTLTLTVKSALTNSSVLSTSTITKGGSVTLTGKASGGTSPYTYKFEAKGSTDPDYTLLQNYTSTATKSWTPKRSAAYSVRITVKDNTGATVTKVLNLTVKA